jgi:hypothetical protein
LIKLNLLWQLCALLALSIDIWIMKLSCLECYAVVMVKYCQDILRSNE